MGFIGMCLPFVLVQILLLMVANAALTTTQLAQRHPDGCRRKCGDLEIPYPFGTETNCSLNEDFLITCNTQYNPPVPFWASSNLTVTNIAMEGRFQVLSIASQDCYHFPVESHKPFGPKLNVGRHFRISEIQNKFTVIGCDSYGYILGKIGKKNYKAGCISSCESLDDVTNASCSGIGCCQIDIPKELRKIRVYARSFNKHINVSHFNPCSYAFVIEKSQFHFSSRNLSDITEKVPIAVDWSIIGQGKCEEARNKTGYACHDNTFCYDANNSAGGYLCNCSYGFQGNPYLPHGCKDIDECKQGNHNCHKHARCENIQGNYTCKCFKGYKGDGRKDGEGCTPNMLPVSTTGLCVGLSFAMVLVASSWIYCVFRNRRLRKEYFKKNGGLLLEQQLSKGRGTCDTRIFSENELKKATNNFDEKTIICKGSSGVVYKGILEEDHLAIKKLKRVDQSQVIGNEVIVLSKIKHRNLVKLLGCCLETEVPSLVYEYASKGTLFEHIHNNDHPPTIPWEIRLRIAAETAGVLSYLHSTADNTAIIHGDVKSSNILLHDDFVVKVSDFRASMLVPMDETENQFYEMVQSTRGYLDPEYLRNGQFTEKSDVYSFGVVLLELMTGKEVISFKSPKKEKFLVMYFDISLKEGRLSEIIQKGIADNDNTYKQIEEVAELASRCLSQKVDERPSMMDVLKKLDGLRMMNKDSGDNVGVNIEETKHFHGDGSYSSGMSDCMKDQVPVAFDGGR